MDAGNGSGDEGNEHDYPPVAWPAGASAGRSLAQKPTGYGGYPNSQFQPCGGREPAARAARRADGHHSDGPRRLSAALLDRAPGPVLHLRIGKGDGTSALSGPPRIEALSRIGN